MVAGVLVIACGASAISLVRHRASRNGCAVAEQLGRQWIAMARSVTSVEGGPGEREDLLASADKESTMSDTIRAGAGSVSTPTLKDQLRKWARVPRCWPGSSVTPLTARRNRSRKLTRMPISTMLP
ncbi:hypothetical protein MSM1_14205 [Mycobacterium sp. SM1]|uniref:hypothetical protein n=1 Tax=Mycobacterium sp. SM1 TaxID=2816243 RepID=UPI001BCB72D7|nr:hypothetical protein [Mycobacterium sp. SM1]MBS4729443.1 hypothetical protein [Mycobacterium sp. SM1]